MKNVMICLQKQKVLGGKLCGVVPGNVCNAMFLAVRI